METPDDLLPPGKMDLSEPASTKSLFRLLNPDNKDDEKSVEVLVYNNDSELSDPGEFRPVENPDSTPDRITSPDQPSSDEENTGKIGAFSPVNSGFRPR